MNKEVIDNETKDNTTNQEANAQKDLVNEIAQEDSRQQPQEQTLIKEVEASQVAVEQLKEYQKQLQESTEIIKNLKAQIETIAEKHTEEIETLKTKLPEIREDKKATIEGYFNYDIKAREYMNTEAKNDYSKAVEDFNLLFNINR